MQYRPSRQNRNSGFFFGAMPSPKVVGGQSPDCKGRAGMAGMRVIQMAEKPMNEGTRFASRDGGIVFAMTISPSRALGVPAPHFIPPKTASTRESTFRLRI